MESTTVSESQRTSSRELLVDLTGVARGGYGLALQRSLRDAIRSGRLRPGTALPSTRGLAADLGVARSVVVLAYEQLAAEGYLVTRRGSAARVARMRAPGRAAPAPRPGGPAAEGHLVDFRPGVADLGSFPRTEWDRAASRALAALPDAALGYGDSRGLPKLREALAGYLGRVRGAIVDPEHLVVVNGFAQGLTLIARLFRGLGIAAVGVEDPGSVATADQLAAHDLAPVGIPVDRDGLNLDAVPATSAPLRAVLATPAHQFPTGAILSPDRRRRLLAWADRVDGYLVEDDYDAEYRYDHQPVATVQGLGPDRVLLGGSTSKTLAPGLRLGWLAVPPGLSAEAAGHKRVLDLMSPVLEQATFAELLGSGAYDRHIRRTRARYRRRRDALLELLAAHLPEGVVTGEAAGLHLLVQTPTVRDEAAVIGHAARQGVGLTGVASYRRAAGPAGFVLAYAHLGPDQLRRGVLALAAAVRAVTVRAVTVGAVSPMPPTRRGGT